MSIYLGNNLIQLVGQGLEKVYSVEKGFSISETHTSTTYEYPQMNLVPISDETTSILKSDSLHLWIFHIKHKTENIEYITIFNTSNGKIGNYSKINKINGTITDTQLITPEYRNTYGQLFRLIVNRKDVVVYQGDYVTTCSVYKIK